MAPWETIIALGFPVRCKNAGSSRHDSLCGAAGHWWRGGLG